ncbi:MAG: nucleotidyl transferase AbiEii/AbiGii toxin family protein [Deltaproteobacteria bacterium]|nr:nucleotidyl transferase AbiEii/AbiGii toxin family protein [Deltaproteobacteria bacterium]
MRVSRPTKATAAGSAYLALRAKARREHRPTDELLQLYVLEGFLGRLASSRHASKLVLKGGVLLAAYDVRRPTRDVDLQGRRVANDRTKVLRLIKDVAAIEMPDGLTFATDAAMAETIRDGEEEACGMSRSQASARLEVGCDGMGDLVFLDRKRAARGGVLPQEGQQTPGSDASMTKSNGFEYVNRKGLRYFLCETKTKTGKPRYVFSREPTGTPVATIPGGYEVAESVNGVVSLRKAGSCQIREEEIAVVKSALAKHPRLRRCKVDARKRELVVYEAHVEGLKQLARVFPGRERALERVADNAPLMPVLRFLLDDDKERMFVIERMVYRGSGGWHGLDGGPLEELAERYVRHIGRESFFELT